jgi:AcrR family transcriptional regulator
MVVQRDGGHGARDARSIGVASDELRRRQVIETALELFGQHGYDAANLTGMQTVASRTRVGKATVYRLFGDRVGLYRATVTVAAERFITMVAAARQAASQCDDRHERARIFLLHVLTGIRQRPEVWHTLSDRPRNADASAALTAVQRRARAAIIDAALADFHAGRTLTPQQAEWAAHFIYGGLAEILRSHLSEASEADDVALVSFLVAVAPQPV